MCGRFALTQTPEAIAEQFGIETLEAVPTRLEARHNIAPSQYVGVVRIPPEKGRRGLDFLSWGLVPFWAKQKSIGQKMINARSETAAAKPAFRAAMRHRRGIIPASGFFEWQARGRGLPKQPYYIQLPDARMMGLAALWERWQGPGDEFLETCTILTAPANPSVEALHDRMPVILKPGDYARWLDPSMQKGEALADLLVPWPGELTLRPVSTRLNDPTNDDPTLLEPAGELF